MNGIYGDKHLQQVYTELKAAVDRFVPIHAVAGNIVGTTSEMRAKAKHIKNLADSLVEATKAVLPTRK